LGFGQRYHVDGDGQLAPKQLILSVLNEMHTNSYTGPRLLGSKSETRMRLAVCKNTSNSISFPEHARSQVSFGHNSLHLQRELYKCSANVAKYKFYTFYTEINRKQLKILG
jgi:hypothetical protein